MVDRGWKIEGIDTETYQIDGGPIYKFLPNDPEYDYEYVSGGWGPFPSPFKPSTSITFPILRQLHIDTCESARSVMEKKNADYSDAHSVFGNLDLVEALTRSDVSTEGGILIRLGDKLSRLYTGTKRDLQVTDEGFEDTVRDSINYLILLLAKRKERALNAK